jgi:NADPH-dependent 2,4-dienoyl-CoA reductase/sulfur reductase-like enzyme
MYSLELMPVAARLRALGLDVRTETLVERVEGGTAHLLGGGTLGPFDTIVLSTGATSPELPESVATLRAAFSAAHPPTGTPPVYAIGDAVAPRGFWAATSDGHRLARSL